MCGCQSLLVCHGQSHLQIVTVTVSIWAQTLQSQVDNTNSSLCSQQALPSKGMGWRGKASKHPGRTTCTPCQAPSATSLVSPGVYTTQYAHGRASLLPPGGPPVPSARLTINCDLTIGYDHCPTHHDACVITTSLTNWCVNAGAAYSFAPTLIFDNMHEYQTPGGTKYDCMQVNSDGSLQGFHYYGGSFWGAVAYTKESPLVCD